MTPPVPDDATDVVLTHCRHCGAPQPLNSSFCSKCGATSRPVSDVVDPLRDKLQALMGNELEVERELGRGGMAAVYAAFDPALQRRVAVKVLLPEIAEDHGMAERSLREGLQHAHDRGVVHRDVKPANVLIDREGRAIVSDFGIARRDKGPRTTGTEMVVGTWAYMSPEQRSAQQVTPATDQYAFGVMAFELLTGQLPFNGTPAEMLRAHMMLAKEPTDRFSSLRDAERAFRKMVPDEGQTTLQMAALTVKTPGRGSPGTVIPATARAPKAPKAPKAGATQTVSVNAVTAPMPVPTKVVVPAPAPAVVAVRPRWPWVIAAVVVLGLFGIWAAKDRFSTPTVAQGGAAAAASPNASRPADNTQGAPAAAGVSAPAPVSQGATAAPSGAITPTPLAGAKLNGMPDKPAPKTEEPTPTRTEPAAPAARTLPAYALADARRLGREFVTLLNQRRYRDIAQFTAMGGDAAVRAELIKLTESATDFAVGFDRVPGTPEDWTSGFVTEFHLDLEWKGGARVMRIRLYASPADGTWRTVGFAADLP